ncbi:endonuclease/exonuclease/phosphatase family protein [Streptomyces sp. URMC 129]|uniref:endonuclease/exonuclease/phosphatase family protein n=1 Tax=Streptomyces sp. URMC 129 TaxID=3423407 RepID=UPI003F1A10B6
MTPAAPTLPLPLLTAVTTLVTLESLRLSGTTGTVAAAVLALCAAAGAGPLTWWLGTRRAVTSAVGALAVARLLVQVPAVRTVPVVALVTGVALAALVLVVRRAAAEGGPGQVARAIALGVGVDVALRLTLDLLDPVWRGGLPGWLVALVSAALLGALAWRADAGPAETVAGGGAEPVLLGPAFGLYAVLLASPGLVAARAGVSPTAAGLWIAAGTVLAVWLLSETVPRRVVLVLPVAVLVTVWLPGLSALAALAGVAVLPLVLRRALTVRLATGRGPLADLAVAGAGAVLGAALLVLPYRLGWVPGLFATLAALGLALAALRAPAGAEAGADAGAAEGVVPGRFVPVIMATLLLAAPPLLGAVRPAPDPLPTDTAGGVYRLLSWNVHAAVDRHGELNPEAVLDVIEESGAHVVVLQEVPRGWTGAGGLDLAAWLERHLDVETVWARAADRQTGNLVLTSLPVRESATGGLPGGRSWARVTVGLADGERARVVTTHLDGGGDPGERLRQLDPLLRATGDDPHTVLAGDLNARPGSREIETVREAGFRSAQDENGDPDANTAVSPPRRVDWILGAADVSFADFRLRATTASDHLPLAVTVFLD